jgi:hypothetical protein
LRVAEETSVLEQGRGIVSISSSTLHGAPSFLISAVGSGSK